MAFNIEQISKNAFAEAFAHEPIATNGWTIHKEESYNYQPEKAKPKRKTQKDKPVSGQAAAGKGRGRPSGSKKATKNQAPSPTSIKTPPPAVITAPPAAVIKVPLTAIMKTPPAAIIKAAPAAFIKAAPTANPNFILPSAMSSFPSFVLENPLPTIHHLLAVGSGGASSGIPTSAEDFHRMVEASPNKQLVVAILQAAQVHVQMNIQSRALIPSNAVNVEVAPKPSSLVNAPVVPVPSTSYVEQANEVVAENVDERDWKSLPLKKRKLYVPKPANENAKPKPAIESTKPEAAVENPKKRRTLRTPRVSRVEPYEDEDSNASHPVTIVRKTDFELYKEEEARKAGKALKVASPPEAGRQSARIAEKKQSKVVTTIYMPPADEMSKEEFMFHLGLMPKV